MQAMTRANKYFLHPHKFALYGAMVSIIMMFIGLSSAYVVRRSGGGWLEFQLPTIFYFNTAVILLSSVSLQISYWGYGRGRETLFKTTLVIALLLGITFLALQYRGWELLNEMGIFMGTNSSGDFIFMISGIHALHIVGGIGAISVSLLFAFMQPFDPTPKRKLRFELTVIYWHFVDIIWLYLVLFFYAQQS